MDKTWNPIEKHALTPHGILPPDFQTVPPVLLSAWCNYSIPDRASALNRHANMPCHSCPYLK